MITASRVCLHAHVDTDLKLNGQLLWPPPLNILIYFTNLNDLLKSESHKLSSHFLPAFPITPTRHPYSNSPAMPPRKRPTAFEVSFGSDDTSTPPIALRRDVVSDNSPFAKHPSSSRSSSLSAPPPRQGASRNGFSAPNPASTSSRDAGPRYGGAAREKRREGREERPSPRVSRLCTSRMLQL